MEKGNGPVVLFSMLEADFLEHLRQIVRTELQQAQTVSKPQTYAVEGMTKPPILKAHDVCRLLSISRQTLHMWTSHGIIKAYKVKSRLFYLASDVEKLVNVDLSKC
jgi:hypothetical protein